MDTTTYDLTPQEIDTFLAENWGQQARLMNYIESDERIIDREQSHNRTGYNLNAAQERWAENVSALATLREDASPYEHAFYDDPWDRYYVVRNTGGHVHRDMYCTTCFPTTSFGWLPELSDCDEAEMVGQYGEMACTVCFPDAPAHKGFGDGTSALARYSEAERAERAASKNERAAVKAAKTLDTPVKVSHYNGASRMGTDRIETVHAAKAWIKDCIDYMITYGYNFDAEAVADGTARLTEALSAKGIDVAPMIIKWTKAARKNAA